MSIKDFSEMCHLTPQALRFYHAEGLLVPAHVDQRTGFRSYEFAQVEQAMTVTLLRDAGLGVKQVRLALDEPDQVPALLDRHHAEVLRLRAVQDDAIQAARAVFGVQPEVARQRVPARTVLTRPVYGTPPGRNAQEWAETEAVIEAATASLVESVAAEGGTVVGRPWRALAPAGAEESVWLVKVAVDGLPGEVQDAVDEVSTFVPGRNTMAKYCTAVLRLTNSQPLDGDMFVNIAWIRQEVWEDGVLTAAPLEPMVSLDSAAGSPESSHRDAGPGR